MIEASGLPRRTGHRVFPSTALRRHCPMGLSDKDVRRYMFARCVSMPHHMCRLASAPRQPLVGVVDQATVSRHRGAFARGSGLFYGTLIALRHSCIPPHLLTLCRSQALRSRRVMLSRPSSLQGLSDSRSGRHVAAYTFRFRCLAIHLETMETVRASDSTSHLLSQHAATLTPGSP